MGRTGREMIGDLPPIGYKFPVRIDVTSESEGGTQLISLSLSLI